MPLGGLALPAPSPSDLSPHSHHCNSEQSRQEEQGIAGMPNFCKTCGIPLEVLHFAWSKFWHRSVHIAQSATIMSAYTEGTSRQEACLRPQNDCGCLTANYTTTTRPQNEERITKGWCMSGRPQGTAPSCEALSLTLEVLTLMNTTDAQIRREMHTGHTWGWSGGPAARQ